MNPSQKSKHSITGSSLQEVLVAIAIFVVGILAVAQLFPQGQRMIIHSKNTSLANSLAQSEINWLTSHPKEMPQQVLNNLMISRDTQGGLKLNQNLLDRGDDFVPSWLNQSNLEVSIEGNLIRDKQNTGESWMKALGHHANSWVIGEGKILPAPQKLGDTKDSYFGSLVFLHYAPILYEENVRSLFVYGLPFILKNQDPIFVNALETGDFYMKSTEEGFQQIWIRAKNIKNFRLKFKYLLNDSQQKKDFPYITLNSDSATIQGEYIVFDFQKIRSEFIGSNEKFKVIPQTINLAPLYQQIPLEKDFELGNPYQYKVFNKSLGALLIHPEACQLLSNDLDTAEHSLIYIDYGVLDWRILKDEFIWNGNQFTEYKLRTNALLRSKVADVDQKPFRGLGATGFGVPITADFILMDLLTGGVFDPTQYKVDYAKGTFRFIGIPKLILPNKLAAKDHIQMDGRPIRAFYRRRGEWAVSLKKEGGSNQNAMVEVAWNQDTFQLGTDSVQNMRKIRNWANNYKKVVLETLVIPPIRGQ